MQFTMGNHETREPESQATRPLMAASPDAQLPSLRSVLWAVVWVIATILIVAQYAIES